MQRRIASFTNCKGVQPQWQTRLESLLEKQRKLETQIDEEEVKAQALEMEGRKSGLSTAARARDAVQSVLGQQAADIRRGAR